jgi:hypothetical protein
MPCTSVIASGDSGAPRSMANTVPLAASPTVSRRTV